MAADAWIVSPRTSTAASTDTHYVALATRSARSERLGRRPLIGARRNRENQRHSEPHHEQAIEGMLRHSEHIASHCNTCLGSGCLPYCDNSDKNRLFYRQHCEKTGPSQNSSVALSGRFVDVCNKMSLAVRLLLAFATLAVLVTALLGLSAREVSRREVERGFEQRHERSHRGSPP